MLVVGMIEVERVHRFYWWTVDLDLAFFGFLHGGWGVFRWGSGVEGMEASPLP